MSSSVLRITSNIVILDRDGVINLNSDQYIKTPEEWVPVPGSLEAIARLCRADFRVVLATNQSGISKGLLSMETLNKINNKMMAEVQEKGGRIDAIFLCPHSPEDNCNCRKPKPGLLLEIGERLGASLLGVPFVGDSASDIYAANAVGAQPILVETGNGNETKRLLTRDNSKEISDALHIYEDLASFVADLLDSRHSSKGA